MINCDQFSIFWWQNINPLWKVLYNLILIWRIQILDLFFQIFSSSTSFLLRLVKNVLKNGSKFFLRFSWKLSRNLNSDIENSKIEFIFPNFFIFIFIFGINFFPIFIRQIVKVKELFNLYKSKLGNDFLRFSLKYLVKLIFVQRTWKSYLCLYLLYLGKISAEWEKLKCSQIN